MGFLEKVTERKRAEVAARMASRPVADLERAASRESVRDFRAAIAGGGKVIAEVKARTPSVTSFRQSASLDTLAETYERCGAAAISVVTDEPDFGTSLDDLRRIRGQVSLPVIAKDFVLDPYQVVEARAYGADAILLIARMLDWNQLTGLLELTHRLGMSALVETHDEAELKVALQTRAPIVGVNNRDLDTMTTSLDTTRRLARLVPDGIIVVAESGIKTRGDIEELESLGVGAYLIGGSLLDANDPGAKLTELMGE